MRTGGGSGARPALARALKTARSSAAGVAGKPALGVAAMTPLMLAAAVAASGPSTGPAPVGDADVMAVAAVAPAPPDTSGPAVVLARRDPANFRVAVATASAPPPAAVVTAPGTLRIPAVALSAYRNAESMMTRAYPDCGVSWNLLAGIGRIESGHANNGATDARGKAVSPIYGPALDGTLPGNEIIVQSRQAGRVIYARAMGPMQFLPGTWSRYASDGDGDGTADPQNVYDAALGAARYLCSGNMNLRNPSNVMSAILRYNNSTAYARNVLGWAAAYATGVEPVNLPPISGPVPPISDAHLDNFQGLGPDLPMTAVGMGSLNQTGVANRLPVPPGPLGEGTPHAPQLAPCAIFCITGTPVAGPLAPDLPPPGALPPAPPFGLPFPPPAPAPPFGLPAPPAGLFGAPPPAPNPLPAPLGPARGPAPGPAS